MKKLFPCFVIYICFLLSCSNPQTGVFADIDYTDTVKLSITEAGASVLWTSELEPELLQDKKNSASNGFKTSALSSVESILVLEPSTVVYPSLKGFGSLDTSSFTSELRTMLNSFCSSLVAYHNSSVESQKLYSHMSEDRSYMLTVFLYDSVLMPPFVRYILGKPKDVGIFRQIPIRFYSYTGYVDMHLYVVQVDSQWYIDQITYGDFVYE